MAQLAFGVVGAAIGSYYGQSGLGFAAGTLAYSYLYPPDDIIQESPIVNKQFTTTSAYGLMRNIAYGTIPVNGNIIDGSDVYITRHQDTQDTGGKGGGGQDVVTVAYTTSIDLAIGLGDPISDVIEIYANDTLIYDISENATITSPEWLNITIYKGTEDQQLDPTLQVLHGVDTPAYRGEAYVVFTRFQLADFGGDIPSFRFHVVTASNDTVSENSIYFGNGNIGSCLLDRYSGLIYYTSTGQIGNRAGYVYDSRSENDIIPLRWSDDFEDFDEGGGGGLFSIPTFLNGVLVPASANEHFFINVETTGGSEPAVAFYQSKTGAYLGLEILLIYSGANTKCIVSDETSGTFFRNHAQLLGDQSKLESWAVVDDAGISMSTNGTVIIPISGRTGATDWVWHLEASYPEGTTRDGTIAFWCQDNISNVNYLCYIKDSDPNNVSEYVQLTEYTLDDITAICWDSIQDYFWVMGQSDTTGHTRLKAFDLNCVEVPGYSFEWANTLYTTSRNQFTYDPFTFSIWLFDIADGTLYQWHTIDNEFKSINTGFSTGQLGTGDSLVYINATKSAWRKKGDGLLDIYRTGRIADDGVPLDQVIDDLCNRAGLQPGEYDATALNTTTVSGYKITKSGTIRENIAPLQQAYLFDGIDEGDLIRFKFRGDPAVATIEEKDLGATNGTSLGGSYISINREMDLKLPKKTELTYYNRDIEYEQNTQIAKRTASYLEENSSRITLPLVLTDDEGARLADIIQHLPYIEREVYEMSVMPKWQYLVAGDVIDIEYQGRTFTARILSKDFENGLVNFICSREESSILQSFLSGGSAPGRDVQITYNPLTNSIHLDIPLLTERENNAGYYLAAGGLGENWAGGNIYKSTDGNSFSLITTITAESSIGSVDQAIGPVLNHSLWDRTTVITVYMRSGELSSVTELQALQGQNPAVVGNHGRWEIINFVNATLIEPGVYQLDTFLRGRLGTEWASDTHQLGDVFVLLDPNDIDYINDSLNNLNVNFLYRAVSLGGNLYGTAVINQLHTNTGVCLKPYAPAQFKSTKNNSTLDITFTWVPRTRFLWSNAWSGIASDPEVYEIEIPNYLTSVTRTVPSSEITGNSYVYTRVDQLADDYPINDITAADFKLYPISPNVGRGYSADYTTGVGPEPHPMAIYAVSIGATTFWECSDALGNTELVDAFNNFPLDFKTDPVLEAPSILPGSSKTCVEFDNDDRVKTDTMLADAFVDSINFSLSLIYRPLELTTRDDQSILTLSMDPGAPETNMAIIRRRADGTLEASHVNEYGNTETVVYSGVIPNGQSAILVITYSSAGYGSTTYGPFRFYVNGTLAGEVQARTAASQPLEFEIGPPAETSGGNNDQHRQSHIFAYDHELTQQEVTNLHILSGI